jgi:inorganic pyrophosphatase
MFCEPDRYFNLKFIIFIHNTTKIINNMTTYRDDEVDVFIEISKNSHIKYEYDKNLKILKCDRILHTPFKYLFNYGFIPNTISPDGDPLDAVVIMEEELVPGCIIRCKILGCLETQDDSGVDPKMILCPANKVDPTYTTINDIRHVPHLTLKKIHYFFSHYKDLENKSVQVGELLGKEEAIRIYQSSLCDMELVD